MKAKISIILRIAVSAALILFLVWSVRGRLSDIAGTLAKTNMALFWAALVLFAVNIVILSGRIKLLFDGEGLGISYKRTVQLTFIGYFFNNFMPTAVGGDIVKAYYAYRQTKEKTKSVIAVFMDRFIGLFSFVLIALLAFFFSWSNIDARLRNLIFILGILGAIILLSILNTAFAKGFLGILSRFKFWNMGERLSNVYMAVHDYRNKKLLMIFVVAVSFLAQSVYFFVIYLLAKALGANILLKTVFLIMPVVSVASMLPSIGGLGLREGAMVALFGPAMGIDKAFSASILLLAVLLIISLIGAAIYISASQFKIKNKDLSVLDNYGV